MQVSVVIATQNVAKVIDKCLASLLPYYEQGYVKEIIVVDGESTDGTLDILNKYPVKLVPDKHRIPYNPSFARNIGWRAAKSELVMFLDSDAHLGEDFFPQMFELFNDEMVGIVGCRQLPVVENRVMKTIGEWWDYQIENAKKIGEKPHNLIQRIYCKALGHSSQNIVVVGPCYVVRKKCLEELGGFDEQDDCADTAFSLAISRNGYKAKWWIEAPVYHRPRDTIKGLVKQRYFYGRGDGAHIWKSQGTWCSKLAPMIIRLGTPFLGLRLAIHYKNLLQFVLFPLAHYAWITGYIVSIIRN